MTEIKRYEILYTETAICDIEEKAAYIAERLSDPALAELWYIRLRDEIQKSLSSFPEKYPVYDVSPWNQRGIRFLVTRNDVVLYSVDHAHRCVYIRAVCTRGRDIPAHMLRQDEN